MICLCFNRVTASTIHRYYPPDTLFLLAALTKVLATLGKVLVAAVVGELNVPNTKIKHGY